ncbi:dCTP deaminase [Tessaracoccus caeni]|uniref:dCTP deaminase n=1 Tax=Tessaracoccus caeni TaxID=3031239 RepID=UPI0038738407
MILTGLKIRESVENGDIVIDPFDHSMINPNSYNYRLGDTLLVSQQKEFDASATPGWVPVSMPQGGYLLEERRLYLGSTFEIIGSHKYVTSLIGRSSMGRLGLFVQVTADLGHQGAVHRWTLELYCVQPIWVYPGMKIGQVSFWKVSGASQLYDGNYGRHFSPAPNEGDLRR